MAEQLKLVRTYDFEADQSSLEIGDGSAGFKVAYEGWKPKNTPDKNGRVQEALTLRVDGTATDHLASRLQAMADKIQEAQNYFTNGAPDYAVWFRVQLQGESQARQSLVYDLQTQMASSVYDVAIRQRYHINQYTLGIERAAWWEGTACGTITGGSVSVLGGTLAFGTIPGDLPGRIAQVKISALGTVTLFPSGQYWLGMKSNKYGAAGSFVPYWSFGAPPADAYNGIVGGVGSPEADSTTRGGTRVSWGAAGGGPSYLVQGLALCGVTTNYLAQRGSYLVLLRAKLAGTAEVSLQMQTAWARDFYMQRSGNPGDQVFPNARVYPRVQIISPSPSAIATSAWHYYEMGNITIPPNNQFINQQSLETFSVLIYGQFASGTASIYIDGLVLIPSEGMVWLGNPESYISGFGASADAWAVNSPSGFQQGVTLQNNSGYPDALPAPVGMNTPVFMGGMPPGNGGMIVLAAENNAYSSKVDTASVEIKYFPRWQELRGND